MNDFVFVKKLLTLLVLEWLKIRSVRISSFF